MINATIAQHIASRHAVVAAIGAPGWREYAPDSSGIAFAARAWQSADGGVRVVASVDEIGGAEWLHVSMSRRSRMPSYDDLARVKRVFIGDDRPAYQVFPVRKEHVNLHNFCLHLWAPLGVDPFPDLAGERMLTIAGPMEKP